MGTEGYRQIHAWIARIPPGRVATYGQLALLAGRPRGARYAARAVSLAPPDLPCHRVVGANGRLAPERVFGPGVQAELLRAEGVAILPSGRVDLARCRFVPEAGEGAAGPGARQGEEGRTLVQRHTYQTQGVCSQSIHIALEGGVVKELRFVGGCNGNLKGICALAVGQRAEVLADKLAGITCGFKNTSCPDQLSRALREMLEQGER